MTALALFNDDHGLPFVFVESTWPNRAPRRRLRDREASLRHLQVTLWTKVR